jgi:hypothetical protein
MSKFLHQPQGADEKGEIGVLFHAPPLEKVHGVTSNKRDGEASSVAKFRSIEGLQALHG